MNNLIKIIYRVGNNRESLLRLYRHADRIHNFKGLSQKAINKISTPKEEFNRIINIRAYGSQLNESMLSVEQDNESKVSYNAENNQVRMLFYNSIHYTKTIMPPNKFKVIVTNEEAEKILSTDWSTAQLHDFISALKRLSYNITSNDERIDEKKYDSIFHTLNTKIPYLDDELLEETLKCLIPFHQRTSVNLKKTFQLLEKECVQRIKSWSIDKMLLIADIYYCLNIYRKSDYIWKLMRKMNSKLNKLTPKNIVQLLFLVSVARKSELNMYEVEVRLEENLNDLSINELGIVALGYFKSRSKIRSPLLLKTLINRLICEMDVVESITFVALMKLIRYSMRFNEIVHFRMLLTNLIPYVPKLDSMALTHLSHACAKATVHEQPLTDLILKRVYNEIKSLRIKDIEKISLLLSTFNIDTGHPIYDKIVEEITERVQSKKPEMLLYPRVLPNILLHLSDLDIYPLDLIKFVMDPSYVEKIHKGNFYNISYGFSMLEYSIKIDRPEYTGPFLNDSLLRHLSKLHRAEQKNLMSTSFSRLLNEIIYVFKENIKDVDLYVGTLLPHSLHKNIVIGIDKNQNYISAEPILSQLSDLSIKKVDDTFPKNVKWLAFVIIHYTHKIKGINKPVGMIEAKIRQLKRIGYIPTLILDDDWLMCKYTEDKVHYLKNLIEKSSCDHNESCSL